MSTTRRAFLATAVGAAIAPMAFAYEPDRKFEFKQEDKKDLFNIPRWRSGPRIFESVEVEMCQCAEFPLDFFQDIRKPEIHYHGPVIMDNHGCEAVDANVETHKAGLKYIHIPTYDIAGALDWTLEQNKKYTSEYMLDWAHHQLMTMMDNKRWTDEWLTIAGETKWNPDNLNLQQVRDISRLSFINSTHFFCSEQAKVDLPSHIKIVRLKGLNKSKNKARRPGQLVATKEDFIAYPVPKHGRIPEYNAEPETVETEDLDSGESVIRHIMIDSRTPGVNIDSKELGVLLNLDLQNRIEVVRQQPEIFRDTILHRQRRDGCYGWGEFGYGVLRSNAVRCFFG